MVLAMIWDAQFGKIAPLDAEGLLAAHFEALFGAPFETVLNMTADQKPSRAGRATIVVALIAIAAAAVAV